MSTRILLADNDDDIRELLRVMLEPFGYVIYEAVNGRECVTAARRYAPDLVLIDLAMPVLDGWGTLTELRSDKHTRELPCAALTGSAHPADRQQAVNFGFDAYLTKPFRMKDLLDTVEHLINQKAVISTIVAADRRVA